MTDRSRASALTFEGVNSRIKAEMFGSLRNRSFLWYWFGMMGFFAAMQMQMLAQGWLVYDMTGSAMALGIVTAGWGLPVLVFSLLGGAIADRVDKRRLLMVTQSSIGIITLVTAVLVASGNIQLWHLMASALASGVVFAFNMPARQAIISELVDEDSLMNAIALNSAAMNVMRIGAPALGGVLIGLLGAASVYFLTAACYVFVLVTLVLVRTSKVNVVRENASLGRSMLEGLRYTRRNHILGVLLAMALVPILFAMPYQMLMPAFAVDVLHEEAFGLGLLMATTGVGALLGSLVMASLGDYRRKGRLMVMAALTFGVALVGLSFATTMWLALPILLLTGAGGTSHMALNNTLLQTNAAPEVRGRVMSIFMMSWGLTPLGVLPAGAIAQGLGVPVALAIGGAIMALLTAAFAVGFPRLRRLE